MNEALVQSILKFTLNARKILEREADEQLQGIYGWLTDGTFIPVNKMPAIVQLDEAKETRTRLERFKEDEATAGLDAKDARKKLLREAAFTWLNRLVAFRMMEERRLLRGTISRLHLSGAYVSWVTEDQNAGARHLHDAGEVPVNPMGEGPRHLAYRRFVLWQCGELARDVSILFDPGTLASRLCPRPPMLKQFVEAMNAENLVEAWKAGNEEVLGWTYEGFIEEENGEVFDKFSKGKKVLPEEIGAATQRFTPRWIVRFLVENSLGRIWLEMHPDSRLAGSLAYFVPVEKKATRPVKLVRDIDFLDPCCGSMHFGLVAFDWFVEMYREELERVGQSGWPAKASVERAEDIPAAVVRHNLFGIDLDLRAVQIAALTMLIKARTLQPGCAVTDLNFACANMEQISGGRIDSIVSQAKFKHPIYERVLRGLVDRMKDSDQLGSLLRPEKVLQELIAEERRHAEANLLLLPGLMPDQFKTSAGLEGFFGKLSEQTLQQLDSLVQTSRAAGQDLGHLVAEASKGMRFLRLVSRHYDVVATNPPYLSRRNMSEIMAAYLDDHFEEGKGDLYAAFVMRCTELADLGGKVAMVTQHSFMFISSYENLRSKLRQGIAVETMAHLGPKAFPNITGEKVNTTAFVFEKHDSKAKCDNQNGTYYRLIGEPEADSKRHAFESGLDAQRRGDAHSLVYRCVQKDFDAIPGHPWVYWISATFRDLFRTLPSLGDQATPRAGMHGGDLFRFGRFWWEVGLESIGRGITSMQKALATHKKWFPYMKGGEARRWYGNQEWVVAFDQAHFRILSECGNKLPSRDYYFKQGVTWTEISSGRFCCRLSPGGFIFDAKGSTCFTDHPLHVLPILSSRFADYCFQLLNPTVSVQAGDIARLPVAARIPSELEAKASCAVALMRSLAAQDEATYEFVAPCWESSAARSLEHLQKTASEMQALEREVDLLVYELYDLSQSDRISIESEVGEAPSLSLSEPTALAVAWISYAIGSVLGRFEIGRPGGLGCGNFPQPTVTALRGLIDPDGIVPCDQDHPHDIAARVVKCLTLMLSADEARDAIRTVTGESGDSEKALRNWLDRFTGSPEKSFWKYHFQLYRKRPVFWPLQSPRKNYTVWVFHERFDKNTLFIVRKLAEERLRLLDREIPDRQKTAGNNRRLAKEVDKLRDLADDLRDFSKQIKAITDRGFTPHIDDGVLLNAAPLHSLLPSWSETKTAWEELEGEKYEWSQQAMEYWPARVKEACQTNKSFAIAHGLA